MTASVPETPGGVRAELEAAIGRFYQAFETADLDTMQSLWLDAADTVCVHPGATPIHGRSAIDRSWALIMANTDYIQFILTDVEVGTGGRLGAGGDLRPRVASVTCTENVLTADQGPAGDPFGGGTAVATHVFVKTDDGWRLWIRHASPVLSSGSNDHD